MPRKKLYRSNQDAYVAGVIGGFAEYFECDSTLLRFGFVVGLVLTGLMPGLLLYVIAWFMIPRNPLMQWKDVTDSTI